MNKWLTQKIETRNQKNIDYYKKAFNALEQNNKIKFNCGACLFTWQWLIYRKMYIAAMLFMVVNAFVDISVQNKDVKAIVSIILIMLLGYFGNSLYYRTIKARIKRGYLKMEDYNPIAPEWCAIIISCSLLMKVLVAWGPYFNIQFDTKSPIRLCLMWSLFLFIPWIVDYMKFHSKESSEEVTIDEEAVNQYLDKANHKRVIYAFWILVSIVFLYMGAMIGAAKLTGCKIKKQLNQIAEDIEKMPNVSDSSIDATVSLNNTKSQGNDLIK